MGFGRQKMSILMSILFGAVLSVVVLLVLAPGAWGEEPEGIVDRDPQGSPYMAGELLVTYKPEAGAGAKERTKQRSKGRVDKELPAVRAQLLSFPEVKNEQAREDREETLEEVKQALEQDPTVEDVSYNYLRQVSYTPDDPRFGKQYGLSKPRFTRAWNRTLGAGVKIAVLDSGIAAGHPDIQGKVAAERDFVNGDGVAQDDHVIGHGTHVAGIAAARTDNGRGIAGGCPGCKLLVGKVVRSNGGGTIADEVEGIIWAANNGAKVINLSLAGPETNAAERNAVEYAWNKGAVIVAAAGNTNSSVPQYPAAFSRAIAVIATDSADRRTSYSSYGSWVDVAAPGVSIVSTVPGGYRYYSGTSFSSPHVAALAGLLAAQGRSNSEIRSRILGTAVDLGATGRDNYYGYGRINAARALR